MKDRTTAYRPIVLAAGHTRSAGRCIQSECNQLGEEFLASGQVIGLLAGQEGFIARPLGEIELRGKEEKVLLFGYREKESP